MKRLSGGAAFFSYCCLVIYRIAILTCPNVVNVDLTTNFFLPFSIILEQHFLSILRGQRVFVIFAP